MRDALCQVCGWYYKTACLGCDAKRLPREPSAEMLAAVRKKPHPTRPDGWDSVHTELWRKMWDAVQ